LARAAQYSKILELFASRMVVVLGLFAPVLVVPSLALSAPGIYDDCTNLHARKIAFDVNLALEQTIAASCPAGGPTLDPECLEDCSVDSLDFLLTPGLSNVPIAQGCDGLTANACANLHFSDPMSYMTGSDADPFQYRLVPLCRDGSGSHEWTENPAVDPPTCAPADYITCVDGTRAVYWAASGVPASDDWILRFSGGHGSCGKLGGTSAAEGCWSAIQDGEDGGSFANKRTVTQSGLLGPSGSAGANRIFIEPCAQDRYTGDNRLVDQPIGGGDEIDILPLRGSRIVTATLQDLVGGVTLGDGTFASRDTLPDFASAQSVLFAGSSAGAIGLSFMLDHFATKAVLLAPGASVRGLLDSRLMPSLDNEEANFELVGNGDSIYGGPAFDVPPVGTSSALAAFSFSESAYLPGGNEHDRYGPDSWNTPAHANCEAVHGPSGDGNVWRCRDQAHLVLNHIETPVLLAHSLRDSNQADAPIEWADGLFVWEDEGNAYCGRQRAQLGDYAKLRNQHADGAAANAGPLGIWAANFSWHEFFKNDCAFLSLSVGTASNSLTLQQATEAWMSGESVIRIDGLYGARTNFAGCVEKDRPLTCPVIVELPTLQPVGVLLLLVALVASGCERVASRRGVKCRR
jgi:hypothetical protein